VQKVDEDRKEGYNIKIKIIRLHFDTNETMPLTQHIRRIMDFILDKRKVEPLLDQCRGMKPFKKERKYIDAEGNEWISIDEYPIVKMFGQEYGRQLAAQERAIRRLCFTITQ
jgi:hypothetical protein